MSYIIGKLRVSDSGYRLFYGKVTETSRGIAYGTIEKDCHIKKLRAQFEIPVKDIVLDLGTGEPVPGKIYGIDVGRRFQGRKAHEFFGPVAFFYKPKRNISDVLWASFDESAAILEKAKLPVLEQDEVTWEIEGPEPKTKWAGYYKHSSNVEKVPHRFAIKPEAVPLLSTDVCYVILHEYAHWLHANHLTGAKVNARWIRLFNTSIKVQTIPREKSKQLLEDLLASQERPSDFKRGLDEEDSLAFNWILRSIKADHAVSIRELDCLIEAQHPDAIKELWPRVSLNKKDLAPVVSEYATVSYKELFAEAFAFYFTKRKLPPAVVSLLEKTLGSLK